MTTTEFPKLTVWAPKTPGADYSVVGAADTVADAKAIAERFHDRKDLKMQDVYIRLGRDGKIIRGNCGPCR